MRLLVGGGRTECGVVKQGAMGELAGGPPYYDPERLDVPDGWVLIDTAVPGSMRTVHRMLFEALVSVDRYLSSHGIEYWLTGGTLLGAVRDGALLPWDDDIDIGMRRESFDILKALLAHHPVEGLAWRTPDSDPSMPRFVPGCFAIDGTAAVCQSSDHPELRKPGLAVDVWPFDELPRAILARAVDSLIRREHYVAESYRLNLIDSPQRFVGRMHEFVLRRTTRRQWAGAMRWLRRWGRHSGLWLYGTETGWHLSRASPEMFEPVGAVMLYGRAFPAPRRPECYLEAKYGRDFRTPPPLELRRPHNRYIAVAE